MVLGLIAVIFANGSYAKELKLDDLFPENRLIEVNITISDQNWDKLRYQRRTRENALPPVVSLHHHPLHTLMLRLT